MIKKLTYKDLYKISGVPERRIRFFGDQGLFSFTEEFKRGVGRQFSWTNCLELLIVAELSNNNIELATIKRALDFIREKYSEALEQKSYYGDVPNYYLRVYPSGRLTIGGERRDKVPMKELLDKESSVLVVDLTELAQEVQSQV